MSRLKKELPDSLTIKTVDELLIYTITLTAIYVAEVLLEQDALLLPDVHEMFTNTFADLAQVYKIQTNTSHKITKVLLLNQNLQY